jgi:hypothetical protein
MLRIGKEKTTFSNSLKASKKKEIRTKKEKEIEKEKEKEKENAASDFSSLKMVKS